MISFLFLKKLFILNILLLFPKTYSYVIYMNYLLHSYVFCVFFYYSLFILFFLNNQFIFNKWNRVSYGQVLQKSIVILDFGR
jgi:hypothetical protein